MKSILHGGLILAAVVSQARTSWAQVQVSWSSALDSSIHAWDEAYDVAVDAAGNSYLVGDANPPSGPGGQKAFIAAYDVAGSLLWSRLQTVPTNEYSFFNRVVALRNGGAIALGRVEAGGTDLLLRRYDLAGAEVWSTTWGSPANGLDFARSLARDEAGDLFVAGRTSHPGGSSTNTLDALVVKFTANGGTLWATRIDGVSQLDDYANELALDAGGNVYVCGLSVLNLSQAALFVAKLDASGTILWKHSYAPPGQGSHEGLALAVDGSGVYTAGYTRPPSTGFSTSMIEVTKHDTNGNFLWVRTIAGTQPWLFDEARHIALDARGNVTVLGGVTNSALTGLDLVLAQWDPNGNARWTSSFDGPNHGDDWHGSLIVDGGGDVFTTSEMRGSFGNGDTDTAIARFDRDGNRKWLYTYSSFPGVVRDVATAAALAADGSLQLAGHTNQGAPSELDFLSVRLVPDVMPFCFGDGSGAACPCGNTSVVGEREGCRNSLGVGAKLTEGGVASLSADSLLLSGHGMPDASALYFQGTLALNGGSGIVFGDGLQCVGGAIARLGAKTNVLGASQYPALGDPSISAIGFVTAPSTRAYQCWYRNDASFCTASLFNLTNALNVRWQL